MDAFEIQNTRPNIDKDAKKRKRARILVSKMAKKYRNSFYPNKERSAIDLTL